MINNIEKECTQEIDINKTYNFGNFLIEQYKEKFIIIKKNKWIILNNNLEFEIFNDLNIKKDLNYIFNKYNPENIINVLTQIEAKSFEKEIILKKEQIKGAYLYLTKRCNMLCPHCYMDAGKANNNELTTSEIKNILENLKKLDYTHITYTGGEICLRNDLDEILLFSNKLGLKNILLTNGTLLEDNFINKVHHCIDEIQISIDGYDEKTNSKIRGKNNFRKAMNAIDLLHKKNIKIGIAITPSYDEVFNNLKNYKNFAQELLEKYNSNIKIKFSLELLDGRNFKANEIKNKKYNTLLRSVVNDLYPDEEINNFALNYVDGLYINNCGFGELTINSNGDIYLCSLINKLNPLLNIKNKDFDFKKLDIKLKKIREKTNSINILPCANCSLNYICGGGCRIKHLSTLNYNNIMNEKNDLVRQHCTNENKEYFFKRMIESNEYLYEIN